MTTQFFKNTLHGIAELSPGYNFGISQTKLYYMFCFYLTYSRLLCRHKISFCMCIFKLRECCSKWGSLCYCGNVCVCVTQKSRALRKISEENVGGVSSATLRQYFSTTKRDKSAPIYTISKTYFFLL